MDRCQSLSKEEKALHTLMAPNEGPHSWASLKHQSAGIDQPILTHGVDLLLLLLLFP